MYQQCDTTMCLKLRLPEFSNVTSSEAARGYRQLDGEAQLQSQLCLPGAGGAVNLRDTPASQNIEMLLCHTCNIATVVPEEFHRVTMITIYSLRNVNDHDRSVVIEHIVLA
ncbi:hypothetical protein DBV15_02267 [Temnothorax longispinosus]|uniref:Uncharacterized protein n=1 Tax=Temnothorax longispinosus TaxID=300112 RepID=A0A4S2L407_9HYME|nr:hypothetical protein DBV15_02267 [Temnothorax longispinosus]